MATVAGPDSMPPDQVGSGGGRGGKVGARLRRKTPSELRGEQLKRINVIEISDESPAPSRCGLNGTGGVSDSGKKMEAFKLPRYIDLRVDEVYPAKKSRFRVHTAKENAKETESVEQASSVKHPSVLSELAEKRKQQHLSSESSERLPEASENVGVQSEKINERCTQSRFRTVAELSSSRQSLSSLGNVDMDKALKGLATREPFSHSLDDLVQGSKQPSSTYSNDFGGEFNLAGNKAPLDFTLKTLMRVVTCTSVNWIYKLVTHCNPSKANNTPYSWNDETSGDSPGMKISLTGFSSEALSSWVYPQSTLPPSLVSVLTSPAAGKAELDFWRKRQVAWEESFRSLYYMLRKNACHIFYACTAHFVVMFTSDDDSGRMKHSSRAYISRSTRGLRSLLREHDISFSMPLCQNKVEQVASEDLVELSEIEKNNLGQTRRPSLLSDIDNSPQSLLAFSGNRDVHGLYDLLLNYRSFLTFLSGLDVPILYSPVPFQNAAVSTPEVRCLEKQGDRIANTRKESTDSGVDWADGPANCLEIVDAYLPPWTICNICALVSSRGTFEASFHTESTSIGLNAAFGVTGGESPDDASPSVPPGKIHPFGISGAAVIPQIKRGLLKSLKYCSNGSYKVTLTPS